MPLIRKKPPSVTGAGHLRFAGFEGEVRYSIEGDASKLRLGHVRLRASVTTTPDVAERAFRAGDGVLTTEEGAQFRMVMLGHSAGGAEVFGEIRL